MKKKRLDLKKQLEDLYTRYHHPERIHLDPIGLLNRELPPADLEIVSFLIAGLAYGSAKQIRASSADLLVRLSAAGIGSDGRGISQELARAEMARPETWQKLLGPWKHRFNNASDLSELLATLARLRQRHGSLASLFQRSFDEDPARQISAFCRAFEAPPVASTKGTAPWRGTGIGWFVSSPEGGGACKRLLMWQRWMVRRDDIDPGPWADGELLRKDLPRPSAARLFAPLDTHVFRWARAQKLVTRAGVDWKSVVEATNAFRAIDAEDPIKYDFAICQAGMESSKVARKHQGVHRTGAPLDHA